MALIPCRRQEHDDWYTRVLQFAGKSPNLCCGTVLDRDKEWGHAPERRGDPLKRRLEIYLHS